MEKLIKLAYLFGIISVVGLLFIPSILVITLSFFAIFMSLFSMLVYKNRRATTALLINLLIAAGIWFFFYRLLVGYTLLQ